MVLAVAVLAGCASAASPAAPSASVGPVVGDLAPTVDGTSLQGHHISVAAWRGSVSVVLFWASWCGPCQAEQPGLNTLAAEERGVHFTGISVDAEASAARSYIARYTVPYDSLLDDTQTQALTLAFEVNGPPQTFVIDPHGRVAAHIVGPVSVADLRADIAAAATR